MLKSILKSLTTVLVVFVLLITVTSCTSREAKSVIKKIDSIVTITESSGELLKEIQLEYNALTEEDKAVVQNENYAEFEAAVKAYNSLMYSSIKREIELTQSLEKNYFANYYNTQELFKAKDDAAKAIEDSNVDTYYDVYFALQQQNADLSAFIESEVKKLYNVQTNISDEFLFAVDLDLSAIEWDAEPIKKQNSKHPTWIICSEPDTTDTPPHAIIFSGDICTGDCIFDIVNIEDKEITVEDKDGNLKKAIVNTQVNFTEVGYGTASNLNERPAYLLKNKDGNILLALKNYEGKDYYVLYYISETHFE